MVVEDHPLELSQLRARGQPQFVAEQCARLPVDGERLSLPAGAIQGQHQLGSQSLSQRRLGRQPLELADDLGRVPERQFGVDPLHLR